MSIHEVQIALLIERLKSIREEKRLSQRQLAKDAGLSHSAISEMESGKISPTLHFLLVIAATLEVELGELITEASKEDKSRK